MRTKRPWALSSLLKAIVRLDLRATIKCLSQVLTDKGEILLGRKPAIGQDITVEESILLADAQHSAQHLILGHRAFAFNLTCLPIAKRDRFAHQLIGDWHTHITGVIKAVEQ